MAIATDRIDRDGHPAHALLHGYVQAVAEVAGALPLALPAAASALDAASLIGGIDGVVLTGSPSNVAAERYGAPALPESVLLDHARDEAVLLLLPRLIEAGVPVLGVCRGFQEMNVAWGGTLDAAVHIRPGRLDHREGDHDRAIERWYDDSHWIDIVPGGLLARLTAAQRLQVNSLHHQGIDRLGSGLRVEATALRRPGGSLLGRRRIGLCAWRAVASGDAHPRLPARTRHLHGLRRGLPPAAVAEAGRRLRAASLDCVNPSESPQ